MSVLVRPRAPTGAAIFRIARLRHPAYSTSSILLSAPRRSNYFNSGYSSSYDPNQETGRGPIFNKHTFGVPQFYPRDLKRRVDDYVVGQDRAKKTICSVIFNHYQGLRRRQNHEMQDQRLREKLQRQKYAQDQEAFENAGYNSTRTHPVEGGRWPSRRSAFPVGSRRQADNDFAIEDEYPGHHEAVGGTYKIPDSLYEPPVDDFYIPEDFAAPEHVKIDKSNLLLIGPTGVGKTYILEWVGHINGSQHVLIPP
jgi:ATP-dependent Clp protease ATP-binding subunit ClpX